MLNRQKRLLMGRLQLNHSNHREISSAIAYKATELFRCTKSSGSIGSSPQGEVPPKVLALTWRRKNFAELHGPYGPFFRLQHRSRLSLHATGTATGVLPIYGHLCLKIMLPNSRRGRQWPVHLICAIVNLRYKP